MDEKASNELRDLPRALAGEAPGRLGPAPEDFRVEEVPRIAPEGHGDHLWVRFEKRGLTTPQAVRRIAQAVGVDPRGAGWAGLKDRHAITIQWASLPGADPAQALETPLEGVTVLEAVRHPRKLRTGQLVGNRFELQLADVPDPLKDRDELARRLETLAERGVPNYFGEQRFGRDNVPRARRWLFEGGPAPRDRFQRKLLVSALQSWLFNAVLARRVLEHSYDRPIEGDLMRGPGIRGLEVARGGHATELARRWEASPTGPMYGPKMQWPEGEARQLEEEVLKEEGVDPAALERFGRLGPGTRRPLRVGLTERDVRPEDPSFLRLRFTLPPGSYATVVLQELLGVPSVRR